MKDGPLPPGAARMLSHLMADRLLADYGVDRQVDAAAGAEAAANALALIRDIARVLEGRAPEAATALADLRCALDSLAGRLDVPS